MKLFSRMFVVLFGTAALVMACAPVSADSLYLGAWSKHFVEGEYNEQHNLVGVEYKSYHAGYFKNSYNRDTFYVGKEFHKQLHEEFGVGIMAAVSYGYRSCFGDDGSSAKICPLPVPYADIGSTFLNPRVFLLGLEAAAISIKVDF